MNEDVPEKAATKAQMLLAAGALIGLAALVVAAILAAAVLAGLLTYGATEAFEIGWDALDG